MWPMALIMVLGLSNSQISRSVPRDGAKVRLSLDSREANALNECSLYEEEEYQDRQGHQHTDRKELSPVRLQSHDLLHADRERVLARINQVDQRTQEVAPRPDKREDGRGSEHRFGEWQDHSRVNRQVVAAVDPRRVRELGRQAQIELAKQKDKERVAEIGWNY